LQQGPFCLRVSSGLASTGFAPSAPLGFVYLPLGVSSLLALVFYCALDCKSKPGRSQGKYFIFVLGKDWYQGEIGPGKAWKGPDFTEREGMSMMECGQFNFIEGIV
jgi:hypothetical protein